MVQAKVAQASVSNLKLNIGHRSDVGQKRERNEDSYLILTAPATHQPVDALLLVADGVGGANAGDVASGILVKSFADWFQTDAYHQLVHYSQSRSDYFIAVLKDLMELVNADLYEKANTNRSLKNMGTTGTAVLLTNNRLFVGHVGDTRLYRFRDQKMYQLTSDHSWVADQVAEGKLTEAEAANHPRRHVVNRVLGTEPVVRVDRTEYSIEPNDILLLASDGLTGLVRDAEIAQIVLKTKNLQTACDELVKLANVRGGDDNITVLIAQAVYQEASYPAGANLNSAYFGASAQQPLVVQEPPSTKDFVVSQGARPKQSRVRNVLLPLLQVFIATLFMIFLSVLAGALVLWRFDLAFLEPNNLIQAAAIIGIPCFVALGVGFTLGKIRN